MNKKCKGEASGSTQTEKGEPDTKARSVREDLRRKKLTEAAQLLSPASPGLQETDPKHTGEEPGGAPDATWHGVQGEWAVPDIVIGDAQGPACQSTRGDAREQ